MLHVALPACSGDSGSVPPVRTVAALLSSGTVEELHTVERLPGCTVRDYTHRIAALLAFTRIPAEYAVALFDFALHMQCAHSGRMCNLQETHIARVGKVCVIVLGRFASITERNCTVVKLASSQPGLGKLVAVICQHGSLDAGFE